MKAIVLIDIPEDNSLDMSSPFNTKVTLDYGDKILELSGNVCEIPQKKDETKSDWFYEQMASAYAQGYNKCIDDILGQ